MKTSPDKKSLKGRPRAVRITIKKTVIDPGTPGDGVQELIIELSEEADESPYLVQVISDQIEPSPTSIIEVQTSQNDPLQLEGTNSGETITAIGEGLICGHLEYQDASNDDPKELPIDFE